MLAHMLKCCITRDAKRMATLVTGSGVLTVKLGIVQGLRAALEIACILVVVSLRSPLLAGCLVLASPLAAPAIKALSSAIQSTSRDAQLATAATAAVADEVCFAGGQRLTFGDNIS